MPIFIPLFFLASCALSLLFTRICITVLPVLGLVDIPRGRHQHERIVPRGGGIGFILAFAISFVFYLALTGWLGTGKLAVFRKELLLELGVPLLLITVLGVLDDKFELSSRLKLVVQLGIAVYFFFSGAGFRSILGFPLPIYAALPVTVVWVIGITNAFNLIDGLDGVAAGLASISAFALALWFLISGDQADYLMVMVIFCGACVGFLRYNFSPAQIFMGDTGSLFIGTFFAYFSMVESAKAVTFTSLLVPVLAMGVPIFDVFLAICRRLYRKYILKEPGVGVMTGDHDHIHHRIQDETKDQKKTAYSLYFLAFLMVGGAMAAALVSSVMQGLSFAILLVVLFVAIRFATIEFYDAASLISEGIRVPHRKFLFTALHPIVDLLLLSTAYFVMVKVFLRDIPGNPFSLRQALCYIAPFPVVLSLSGIYRTYWLRVGIGSFFKLFLMFALASVIVLAIALGLILLDFPQLLGGAFGNNVPEAVWQQARKQISHMREFYTAYVFFGCSLIMAERFILHYLECYGFKMLGADVDSRSKPISRTLIYGGGLYCRLFISSQYCANGEKAERRVIGIIDDNASLHGLNVYGLDVLGNCDDLPRILEKYKFDEVVIALKAVTDETRKRLIAFGKANKIKIREFRITIDEYNSCEDIRKRA